MKKSNDKKQQKEIKNTTKTTQQPVVYALNIKDLHKSYGKKEVLKGLNLKVKQGEIFGFIGKNGIGKTTTIDCIVGLKEADSGTIEVYGIDNQDDALQTKQLIGYVPSEPTTYEMMTGDQYLGFVASCYGVSQKDFNKNYEILLETFAMKRADMKRKIREYSHGMKQKVALMASLIQEPTIWILDEPTVGLDIMVYETLLHTIKDFAQDGRAVFITSHNIDLVSKICDRVAIINDGFVEKLIDLKSNPQLRETLSETFFNTYGDEIE